LARAIPVECKGLFFERSHDNSGPLDGDDRGAQSASFGKVVHVQAFQKVIEEAAEVVEAAGEAGDEGRQHLVCEAADLLYHLLVMLAHRDVRLEEVEAELARRFGISGLEEKASRGKNEA